MKLAWTHAEEMWCKQALQWTPQGHKSRRRPKKRDLDKKMWTTGYKYCWSKMEVTELDARCVCMYVYFVIAKSA